MKAVVCYNYGSLDALRCEDADKPIPRNGEVLIRVCAASVNPLDWHLKRGRPCIARLVTGLRKPKDARIGVDVAGRVESVGLDVREFKPGDEVFGSCRGAFAEYVCTSERALAIKPGNATFEQAAAAPVAAYTALQGLRDRAKIRPGQKVLVNGAAGGVGTLAVQVAKWLGADVTGVCSTRNVEMVRSIGADRVIDYTREDFTENRQRYDAIFDLVGNHSLLAYRRVLNPKGTYIAAGVLGDRSLIHLLTRSIAAPVLSRFVSQNFVVFLARRSKNDLRIMHELMKAGKVMPTIDKRYSLSEVPEAIRYVEEGHARGKVVIIVEGTSGI